MTFINIQKLEARSREDNHAAEYVMLMQLRLEEGSRESVNLERARHHRGGSLAGERNRCARIVSLVDTAAREQDQGREEDSEYESKPAL